MKKYIIWAALGMLAILILQRFFPFPGKYEVIAIPGKDFTNIIMIDTINGNAWELRKDTLGNSVWSAVRDR